MNTQPSYTGSYIAIGGLIVSVLAHFGFTIQVSDVITVITGLVTLYGIIHQMVAHKQLAVSAGFTK